MPGRTFVVPVDEGAAMTAGVPTRWDPVREDASWRGSLYVCPECGHRATQRGGYYTHVRTNHLNVQLRCPRCEYAAFGSRAWAKHVAGCKEWYVFVGIVYRTWALPLLVHC